MIPSFQVQNLRHDAATQAYVTLHSSRLLELLDAYEQQQAPAPQTPADVPSDEQKPMSEAQARRLILGEALAYMAGRKFVTPAEGYRDITHALSDAVYAGYKLGLREGDAELAALRARHAEGRGGTAEATAAGENAEQRASVLARSIAETAIKRSSGDNLDVSGGGRGMTFDSSGRHLERDIEWLRSIVAVLIDKGIAMSAPAEARAAGEAFRVAADIEAATPITAEGPPAAPSLPRAGAGEEKFYRVRRKSDGLFYNETFGDFRDDEHSDFADIETAAWVHDCIPGCEVIRYDVREAGVVELPAPAAPQGREAR